MEPTDVKSRIYTYPSNLPAGGTCSNRFNTLTMAEWSQDIPPEYLVDIHLPGMNVLYCMDAAMLDTIMDSPKTTYDGEKYVQMGPARVRIDAALEKMRRGYMRGMIITAVPRHKGDYSHHRIMERHDPLMEPNPLGDPGDMGLRRSAPRDTSSVRYSDTMGPTTFGSRRRW